MSDQEKTTKRNWPFYNSELLLLIIEAAIITWLLRRYTELDLHWCLILAVPATFFIGRFIVLIAVGIVGYFIFIIYTVIESIIIKYRKNVWIRPIYLRCLERAKKSSNPHVRRRLTNRNAMST
jgi:hypothetical protein